MQSLKLLEIDPWLEPYQRTIIKRYNKYQDRKHSIIKKYGSVNEFANGHTHYGLHKVNDGWVFREYAPLATDIYLIGTFNHWQEKDEYKLKKKKNGSWEIKLSQDAIHHEDLYKIMVYNYEKKGERIPSYANRVVQDEETKIFSAQVWAPQNGYQQRTSPISLNGKSPFIYECHIGMATEEEKVGSYDEFRRLVLPRIIQLGYNVIQIMAIQEHPYYGSFGYHVSNYFAASSRFGTPEELKQLIDEAHDAGIAVILDIVHSHAVRNVLEGIADLDLSGDLYFHTDNRRIHPAWDSLCFDYHREETLRFLLSNCRYWIEEYNFDGYRFDGVTSMLYHNHGLEKAFTQYSDYFDGGQNEDAIVYLTLANELIHSIHKDAISVAEEMSGMPGLAARVEDGGIGFDYRMAMGIPDYWIKMIKEKKDEDWNVSGIYYELTNHRSEEKTINYAESHDQALVGDKTIIFRLIDKEMYWHMLKSDNNSVVNRGMALHKMIRLITASTISGGYLNFIGNEFGHPEWIDFPREGNNWSFKHARRQWGLVDNSLLKYQQLNNFDADMIHLLSNEDAFAQSYAGITVSNEGDQVLIFQRKNLFFIFNFSPIHSYTDYGFTTEPGKFKIVLNSDNPKYGGHGLVDDQMVYFSLAVPEKKEITDKKGMVKTMEEKKHWLKIYIPSRACLVLRKLD